ncbi:hypothetical protein PENSPDRAFT_211202 [Peniophora sp. CONT]|nr:hypothetical protein PENSPDRAFT_211202 [Peniophora sp. CONT]
MREIMDAHSAGIRWYWLSGNCRSLTPGRRALCCACACSLGHHWARSGFDPGGISESLYNVLSSSWRSGCSLVSAQGSDSCELGVPGNFRRFCTRARTYL